MKEGRRTYESVHYLPCNSLSQLRQSVAKTACRSSCLCSTTFRLVSRLDLAHPAASQIRHCIQAQGGSVNGLQSAQHITSEFPIYENSTFRKLLFTVTKGTSSGIFPFKRDDAERNIGILTSQQVKISEDGMVLWRDVLETSIDCRG